MASRYRSESPWVVDFLVFRKMITPNLRGTWNSGLHLVDPDDEWTHAGKKVTGIRETWNLVTIGDEGADDEMFELKVTREALTADDRRLLAGAGRRVTVAARHRARSLSAIKPATPLHRLRLSMATIR